MESIELHVRGGGLVVVLDSVKDPAIYMMNPRPEVLFWGSRVFCHVTDTRYEEALAVTVFTDA